MRLFVAVWPDATASGALSEVRANSSDAHLRWVRPENWHVTLAFFGAVDEETQGALTDALASLGPEVGPLTAVLGPSTAVLGRRILYAPVSGLDPLATAVRRATDPLHLPAGGDEPFLGHLTLARARGNGIVEAAAAGVPIECEWGVSEFSLVCSNTRPQGAEYSPVASFRLEG